MANTNPPHKREEEKSSTLTQYWFMEFDGSENLNGVGAGVVLISLEGKHLMYGEHLDLNATNNMADY
jgi:hypothetical protein